MSEQPKKLEPAYLSPSEKAARDRLNNAWVEMVPKEERDEKLRAAFKSASREQLDGFLQGLEDRIMALSDEWRELMDSEAAKRYEESLDIVMERERIEAEMERAAEIQELVNEAIQENASEESAA